MTFMDTGMFKRHPLKHLFNIALIQHKFIAPIALIQQKYSSKGFSLLLDLESKFHSENWRKGCSLSPLPKMRLQETDIGTSIPCIPVLFAPRFFYWDQICIQSSVFPLLLHLLPLSKCHDFLLQKPMRGKCENPGKHQSALP